ncbi:MAG: germination protein YpeB [Oscillospiraceae bacterium]|nr:germination protein YpeB [Oscillospiraceae bacterium]
MYICRRSAIRIICYALALVAVMGEFIYLERSRELTYLNSTENGYYHAFAELVDSIGELNTALQKCRYSSTPPMINSCCADIYACSVSAQAAMGQLPFSGYEYDIISSFAARAADLAMCLSKSSAQGNKLSREELGAIEDYAATAEQMQKELTEFFDRVDEGSIALHGTEDDDSGIMTLSQGFESLEQKLRVLPDFCYDGALSPDVSERKAKLIEQEELVSPEDAIKKAADFMDISPDRLEISSRHEGSLPVYCISYLNGSRMVDITRHGGKVVYFTDSYVPGTPVYSDGEAREIAESFLKNKGYDAMTLIESTFSGEYASFIFAPLEDQILCYPDYVKVNVALDSGRITGFEALNYVSFHCTRQMPEIKVSEEDAAAMLSPDLGIISHRLAVILSDGLNELLCHEFRCRASDGSEMIVYINAVTGVEEEIKPLGAGRSYEVI